MIDFDVQRCTRHCATTNRPFDPGEEFYSVLISRDGNVVREDYSGQEWHGKPEGVLGWWKARMPLPDARKINWAPNDVMLELFEQWANDPGQADIRYILTLLLVRRRVMRIEHEHDSTIEVYCPRRDQAYDVPVVHPAAELRVTEIQETLAELLFAQAS